jgi:hypothetical protein
MSLLAVRIAHNKERYHFFLDTLLNARRSRLQLEEGRAAL